MTTTPSFQEFLVSQKDAQPVDHVVVGNAAGDADSIISALTYGYIESVLAAIANGNGSSSTATKTPMVSITQNDLETQRPEVAYMFRMLGLNKNIIDSLRFIDDPSLMQATGTRRQLTLVDHNRAEEAFMSNQDEWKVVEILDHHFDEQQHKDTCSGDESRNIAFAGDKASVASACTLVAERLKSVHDANNKYPSTLSTLLLGTILLDSVNMIPQAGKGTPRDAAAIQNILENTDWSTIASKDAVAAWWPESIANQCPTAVDSPPDTTRMFDSLQEAKFDPAFWKGLSVQDALRLDYKRFSTVHETMSLAHVFGASAVLMPMKDFLDKPDIAAGIQTYMTNVASVDFLAILLFHKCSESGENRRQLMLCELNNSKESKTTVLESMIAFLEKDGTMELQEIVEVGDTSVCTGNEHLTVRLFDQNNAKASRKQVAPLLMKYFGSQ